MPWFLSISNQTLYQLASSNANGSGPTTFAVQNPVVAFGSKSGGSPLYLNQPYRFSAYAGGFNENATGSTNIVQIAVYNATNFMASATNIAPINTFTIPLPRRTAAADSNLWAAFVLNGNSPRSPPTALPPPLRF